MKHILTLFLVLAASAFGQSFPVKANSSGVITEPTGLVGGLTTNWAAGGLTLSNSNSLGTFINLLNSSNSKQWQIYLGGTADGVPGSLRFYDQTDSVNGLILKSTGQPQFPFFSSAGVIVTDASGNESVVAKGSNSTFFGLDGSGNFIFGTPSGTISGLTTNGMIYASNSTTLASTTAPTNGQLLIGSTGTAPVKATITQSSANQVVVTNGPGSITLSLPQDINTTSSPTFAGLTSPIGAGTKNTGAFTTVSTTGNITETTAGATSIGVYPTNSANSAELEMSNDGRVRVGNTGTGGTPDLVIGHLGASGGGTIIFATNNSQRAQLTNTTLIASTSITSSSATSGVGYSAGAGGTVTQATSRTTGVTLNTVSGAITLVSAAGSATYQTFTVTDSAVAATDTVSINQKSGSDIYIITIHAVSGGSFQVSYATTGGTTTEQPVFQFNVIKGSNN